jgi:hypothetical protein
MPEVTDEPDRIEVQPKSYEAPRPVQNVREAGR